MFYRQIILSQMDTVRIHCKRDIRMVIHNEQCPCTPCQRCKPH